MRFAASRLTVRRAIRPRRKCRRFGSRGAAGLVQDKGDNGKRPWRHSWFACRHYLQIESEGDYVLAFRPVQSCEGLAAMAMADLAARTKTTDWQAFRRWFRIPLF